MTIPSNYRELKRGEIIRDGDYAKIHATGEFKKIKDVRQDLKAGWSPNFTYYRRRHVKKVPVVTKLTSAADVIGDIASNVAVVSFVYPGLHGDTRSVQVISMDDVYLCGLEITGPNGNLKYQFKKFLRSRMGSAKTLIHFGKPLR